jgi:hypothetical protein
MLAQVERPQAVIGESTWVGVAKESPAIVFYRLFFVQNYINDSLQEF